MCSNRTVIAMRSATVLLGLIVGAFAWAAMQRVIPQLQPWPLDLFVVPIIIGVVIAVAASIANAKLKLFAVSFLIGIAGFATCYWIILGLATTPSYY